MYWILSSIFTYKFPKTMKIKNIPHGDFTEICKKLEKKLKNKMGSKKLKKFDFI